MQPPHQHLRINLAEMKAQIVKKIGLEGSKKYFYYLNRFLSLKISKMEFTNLCLRILGQENILFHNQFICSILRNVYSAKAPPPSSRKNDGLRHGKHIGSKEVLADGYQQNGPLAGTTPASCFPGLANGGEMLPVSPRKARTALRDRRTGDRHSDLAPNGMATFAPKLPPATQSRDFNIVADNGHLNPTNAGRLVQHHQELIKQSEIEGDIPVPHPTKLSLIRCPDGSQPVYSAVKAEKVVTHDSADASVRSSLRAPLGIPLCLVSTGGSRRSVPSVSSSGFVGSFSDNVLLDSHTLRERMEHISLAQGLQGVSVDCANLLNRGLDSHMKRLVRSCIELVEARSGKELTKNSLQKVPTHMKLLNGVKPGHQHHIKNIGVHLEVQEQRIHNPISLHDFRVSVELNPSQFGEDWPLLLEKICTHSFGQ